jgi:hypothetical protein
VASGLKLASGADILPLGDRTLTMPSCTLQLA